MRCCLLVCVLILLLSGTGNAYSPDIFPITDVSSVTYLAYGDSISISNDAEYVYACKWDWSAQLAVHSACLLGTQTVEQVLLYHPDLPHEMRWSYDNKRLLLTHTNDCSKGHNLYIFETETEQLEGSCDLTISRTGSWSPLNPEEFYNSQSDILNVRTGTTRTFSYMEEIGPTRIQRAVGYGKLLWDGDTQTPLGHVYSHPDIYLVPLNSEKHVSILDPRTVISDPESLVSVYEINGPWLLWGAHPSSSPIAFTDTILYLTYLPTLESREIFRFSQLGQPALRMNGGFSWSPDRKTIAFYVTLSHGNTIVPEGAVPLIEDKMGTVILNLVWPEEE